ncbi:hypothetical protein HPB51_020822 [Rhipicephalus microplus]|uniref:PiggyBac transposable element-derived protein domain-containing protein n=1 Tax=Rhipicephalus microplus TaxID=6941 RepID=A0A9J6DQD5_RHIMP|nr:hypothetical protein HPB51_020822 [Rhipicephalus microplus]
MGQNLPEEYEEKLHSFQRFVLNLRHNNGYLLGQIGNAYQAPLYFDMPGTTTVEKGAKQDDDEFVESDEEEERGAEAANEYDSSRYIETMRQVNSTPSASVASGDSTPNPSTALMKAIANCNLNPNATAFELPLDNLATGSQSGDAQLPSSSTIEKRALPSAAATATRTDTGREVVVQKILSELPPKQLGESLILAVNSFRGPLSSETLASINSGLEHCKLCNKTGMQDLCVQVDQSAEYLEERDALLERCEMLTYENARIKEQYESALDCNMQTNSKHTVETSKYKEKIEELNKELQASLKYIWLSSFFFFLDASVFRMQMIVCMSVAASRQAAKKNKLESDAEIKKLQQERVKLMEENKLLKTSRNEDNIKETLEKAITEFTKMKSKCDELEETCLALEEASDSALERAKRAEIRILETALKWGLERFEQSKKHVQKVLKEMEGLKASLDPNSLAELVRKERLADLYMKEWKKEYEQFQRKVQDHIEKVEKGQALADLEVIDLPAKPDFEIDLDNVRQGCFAKSSTGYQVLTHKTAWCPSCSSAMECRASLLKGARFFLLFFTTEVLQTLRENTNKYTWMHILDRQTYTRRDGSWEEVVPLEMLRFIELILYIGVVDVPRLHMYWRKTGIFSGLLPPNIMKRDRFFALLAFLSVGDPENLAAAASGGKTWRVSWLLRHINLQS